VSDLEAALRAAIDDQSPFTEESRARVAFAAEAKDLAEHAAGFVRVNDHVHDRVTAVFVGDVARLVAEARQLLAAAVVVARVGGVSWEAIGDELEITRQSVHQKYADDVKRWKEAYDQRDATGPHAPRLPYGAYNTAEVAARLDEWSIRHREPGVGYVAHPDAPVTGGLQRMDPHAESLDIARRRQRLWADHIVPPPGQLAALYERDAELWDKMAGMGFSTDCAAQARESRALAEQHRARAAETAEDQK
jgi:hypothetical protein